MAFKYGDTGAGRSSAYSAFGRPRRTVFIIIAGFVLLFFISTLPVSPVAKRYPRYPHFPRPAPKASTTNTTIPSSSSAPSLSSASPKSSSDSSPLAPPSSSTESLSAPVKAEKIDLDQNLHLLVPATHGDVNLCKTMLSAAMLEYPIPTLIAWEHQDKASGMLGGGSHVAKITSTLQYLNGVKPNQDNELVVMIDAYDIWFQLPKSVLIERYHMVNAHANKRILKQIGKEAMEKENITQTVIFGAGKRCAPNQIHTIACYPIPPSPLPDDIYYGNTDTDLGINDYVSHRQRWLNSGLIVGPVADMRRLFTYTKEVVESRPHNDPEDNGSHTSDDGYHGSDQSIFAIVRGEQEYQREVIRQRYQKNDTDASTTSATSKVSSLVSNKFFGSSDKNGDDSKGSTKEPKRLFRRGRGNIDKLGPYDVLNPPFTHERMDPMAGHPREFGIGVDHFSDLSHQTVNSETDGRFLVHNSSLEDQIPKSARTRFDCKWRLPQSIPKDMMSPESMGVLQDVVGHYSERKMEKKNIRWEDQNLYTHLCLGTIPVILHHNGDKDARDTMWHQPWWQPLSRKAMDSNWRDTEAGSKELKGLNWESHLKRPTVGKGASWAGAWTDAGKKFLEFGNVCRKDYEKQLFG